MIHLPVRALTFPFSPSLPSLFQELTKEAGYLSLPRVDIVHLKMDAEVKISFIM